MTPGRQPLDTPLFTALDGALVAALLGLCWALWGAGPGTAGAGPPALEVVSVAGTHRHPLEPGTLTVPGPLGDSVLQVGPDGVRFLSSPCPLQLCVKSGRLARPGAVAACLPNRVAVRLVGGAARAAEEGVDAVGR